MWDSLTYYDYVLHFTCLGSLYRQYSLKLKHKSQSISIGLTPTKALRIGLSHWDTQESSPNVLVPEYDSHLIYFLYLLSDPTPGLALKYHGEQSLRETSGEDDTQPWC